MCACVQVCVPGAWAQVGKGMGVRMFQGQSWKGPLGGSSLGSLQAREGHRWLQTQHCDGEGLANLHSLWLSEGTGISVWCHTTYYTFYNKLASGSEPWLVTTSRLIMSFLLLFVCLLASVYGKR